MQVTCDIHPWMKAYWYVSDNPYAVVTDKDGKFTIKDIPEGKNNFRTWHEKVGYIKRKFPINIKAGETVDLGKIKIISSKFE